MAYYNVNGKHIDIYCGQSDWVGSCSVDCHTCKGCMVEDLDTHKTEQFIGSEYEKLTKGGE